MVWSVVSSTKVTTLKGHASSVWSVAFSKDGKYLASGSTDSTVKVWTVDNFKILATLKGHSK